MAVIIKAINKPYYSMEFMHQLTFLALVKHDLVVGGARYEIEKVIVQTQTLRISHIIARRHSPVVQSAQL